MPAETTLLERALAFQPAPNKKTLTHVHAVAEELEIALAFARREILPIQVASATGMRSSNVQSWVGQALLRAVRAGLLVKAPEAPNAR